MGKSPRRHERLNESDDDEIPIIKRGRIFGLLQASSINNSKNQILPVNMKDMMQAEKLRLLQRVDSKSRDQFLNRNNEPGSLLATTTSPIIEFKEISGFDDRKFLFIYISPLNLILFRYNVFKGNGRTSSNVSRYFYQV